MPLTRYRAKRDFAQTTEPSGEHALPPGARFVVQQHAARRMHYDFRLEIGGVLKSWAVPKGPSLDPADKRLAVPTEDHPVSYVSFEGHVPTGQYGGGNVIVWDAGTWEVPNNVEQALRKGHLHVVLRGQKLQGAYSLIRMGTQNAWFLRKLDDAWARPGSNIAHAQPQSILTGRRVEDVHKLPSGPAQTKRDGQNISPKGKPAALDPLPTKISPQLATLADALPTKRGWVYELKYDGYRLLARKTGDKVTLWTRNGHDWTPRLASIAQAVANVPCAQIILDGELVVTDEMGRSSFSHLQQALRDGASEALTYCVFDVLAQNGKDLRAQPLVKRRRVLQALFDYAQPPALLHLVAQTTKAADGKRLLEAACARGFEGVVAKDTSAAYAGRRSEDWLKVKCYSSGEWLVAGYTLAEGTRQTLGSLLLGAYDAQGMLLHYCGRVGSGLSRHAAPELWPALQQRKTRKHAFGSAIAQLPKGCVFVQPSLVVQVAYQEQLGSGALRHARLIGLRPDKDPTEVRMPLGQKSGAAPDAALPEQAKPQRALLRLTHPRRRVAPKTTVTKGELVQYVQAAAPLMLAHAAQRPLSLLRCPESNLKKQFFQKHLKPLWPGFGSARVAGKDYPVLQTQEGLLACVQHNVLEWHTWGCRADALAHPDVLTFDLDPGEGVAAAQLIAAAHTVRDVLQSLGFASQLKLTGGKGLHVVMPIAAERSWTETEAVCRLIADYVVAKDPAHFTAIMRKQARRGRVFVDYFRNHQGATAIAPYSCRARPGLAIARPLAWPKLCAQVLAEPWGVPQMRRALSEGYQDPWLSGPDLATQQLSDALCREAVRYARQSS